MGWQETRATRREPLGTRPAPRRRRTRGNQVAAVLITLLLGGCSDADVASPPDETPVGTVSREDLARDLAEWICDGAATCCDSAGVEFDRDNCLQRMRGRELRRWSSEHNRDLSEPLAASCSSALQETAPSCGNPRFLLKPCFQMLDGALPLDAECESKFECAGQRAGLVSCIDGRCANRREAGEPCDNCSQCLVHCESRPDGTSRCAARSTATLVEVGLGENCFALPSEDGSPPTETFECAEGLICDPIGKVCIATGVPPGQPCHPTWGDLLCADSGRCVEGVCARDIAIGEPCDRRGCAEGLYCDGIEGRCAPYVEEGGACGHTISIDLECARGLLCERPRGASEGTCTTPEEFWCSRSS